MLTEQALQRWSGRWLVSGALATALSCSGAAFTAGGESCEDACEGGAAGDAASGGEAGGGSGEAPREPGEGGESGAAQAGGGGASQAGSGGMVGVGGGGMIGIAGVLNRPFPATDVLDDFNRAGSTLGDGWIGAADEYVLKDQQLWCGLCTASALWSGPFAAEQEVFATYAGFDPDAREMNLVLRAQGSTTCEQIEVSYSPESLDVRVAYCLDDTWTDLDSFELLLQAGQQLGGRIHADGTLQLFVDGELLGSLDVSAYPHQLGRIGVSGVAGDAGLFWDDFGGGKWK